MFSNFWNLIFSVQILNKTNCFCFIQIFKYWYFLLCFCLFMDFNLFFWYIVNWFCWERGCWALWECKPRLRFIWGSTQCSLDSITVLFSLLSPICSMHCCPAFLRTMTEAEINDDTDHANHILIEFRNLFLKMLISTQIWLLLLLFFFLSIESVYGDSNYSG